MHLISSPLTSTKPPNYGQGFHHHIYRPAVNFIEKEYSNDQYEEYDKPQTEEEFRTWLKQKFEIENDRVRYHYLLLSCHNLFPTKY